MQKNRWLLAGLIAVVILMTSCGPTVIYEGRASVSQNGWHKDTVAVFNSEITEPEQLVHVLLEVQNTDAYSYSNIWFFVDAISPSGHIQRDTLEYPMAKPSGDWYGKKSWGSDVYENALPYKLNVRFPEKGMYRYQIIQGMRDTVLTGIAGVGIKIIETN